MRGFFFTYILPESLKSSFRGPSSTLKMFMPTGSQVYKAIKKKQQWKERSEKNASSQKVPRLGSGLLLLRFYVIPFTYFIVLQTRKQESIEVSFFLFPFLFIFLAPNYHGPKPFQKFE